MVSFIGAIARAEEMLHEFHKAFKHAAPAEPSIDEYPFELRMRLIIEEGLEFVEACGYKVKFTNVIDGLKVTGYSISPKGGGIEGVARGTHLEWEFQRVEDPDWVEMIDALCDILYVTVGAGISMGITLGPYFQEVHRSNMAKLGGKKDEGGKTLKPEGWTPPDLLSILKAQPGRCG